MDIILWVLAIASGILCGRASVRIEPTKQDEYDTAALDSMRKDLVYYKKLTQDLVAENKELRKKINGN
jgi:hypothetical protein